MLYIGRVHKCWGDAAVNQVASAYNRIVSEARSAGLKTQITLTGVAANWGNACGNINTGSKPSVAEWKKFVATWVPFFYKRGVRRFSLWNEPNLASFLCAGVTTTGADVDHSKCSTPSAKNAALYYKLYTSGYKVIRSLEKKKIIGKTKIWIGEFAGAGGIGFLERILKKYKLKADGLSWHPYQYCNPPNIKGRGKFIPGFCKRAMGGMGWIPTFNKAMAKWASTKRLTTPSGKRVPMYLTEFGYHLKAPYGIPEKYRAKWYPKALEVARKAGVKGFVLYQMYSQPQAWDTSILNADGSPTASFRAIHKWAKKHGYKTSAL
jgi:hypothetical protein